MNKKFCLFFLFCLLIHGWAFSQATDAGQTAPPPRDSTTVIHDTITIVKKDSASIFHPDSALRIVNLTPFFTVHVDSALNYQLQINKNPENYFWYLKNSPVGLRIHKDNGTLSFKAEKSYFLSGKLKYDVNYKVVMGVQNLSDPKDKIDTTFTMVFYNTEIIPSLVKPMVSGTVYVDEGEPVTFKVLCETGSFPLENIYTLSNVAISNFSPVNKCDDEFRWTPPYSFVKETDPNKEKSLMLYFIGTTRFQSRDTAQVKLIVRDALNYPVALEEYNQAVRSIQRYVLQLKYTFLQLDKKLKRTKGARTTFDLTAATTSLTGTIMASSSDEISKKYGKILPSVGLSLVPIREAAVPTKAVDQNQANLVRTSIKRLEYNLRDYQLLGEKDLDITRKTTKLKDELKQVQVQLIDIPVEISTDMSEEELNRYFNSPKVNKKYRLKR
ncbi:hypothetical protein V9K67_13910 [Paraflavisolibacter sp. H34]|uniref:hypothetical protein n=1 Tax=Huijunlia imazamoxiresistens TaxID=3127457 RepID=UPI0030177191